MLRSTRRPSSWRNRAGALFGGLHGSSYFEPYPRETRTPVGGPSNGIDSRLMIANNNHFIFRFTF